MKKKKLDKESIIIFIIIGFFISLIFYNLFSILNIEQQLKSSEVYFHQKYCYNETRKIAVNFIEKCDNYGCYVPYKDILINGTPEILCVNDLEKNQVFITDEYIAIFEDSNNTCIITTRKEVCK